MIKLPSRLHLLKYGLSIVLIFVGLKMVWLDCWYGGNFPINLSLGIIGGVIGVSIVLSLLFPQREKKSGISNLLTPRR